MYISVRSDSDFRVERSSLYDTSRQEKCSDTVLAFDTELFHTNL